MSETNILSETVVTSAGATQHLPVIDGQRHSAVSVWRWMTKGLSTPAGRLHLESAVVGRRLVTSVEAIHRFTRAVAEARRSALSGEIRDTCPQYARERTKKQRERAIERAEREAEAMGV